MVRVRNTRGFKVGERVRVRVSEYSGGITVYEGKIIFVSKDCGWLTIFADRLCKSLGNERGKWKEMSIGFPTAGWFSAVSRRNEDPFKPQVQCQVTQGSKQGSLKTFKTIRRLKEGLSVEG